MLVLLPAWRNYSGTAEGEAAEYPKRRVSKKPDDPPTLADQGIDKNLANRVRKAAAMPEKD